MRSDEPLANRRAAIRRSIAAAMVVACMIGCDSKSPSGGSSGIGSAAAVKPRPPLVFDRLVGLHGRSATGEIFVKPGHAVAARLDATAGDLDRRGTIVGRLIDDDGGTSPYPPLDFQMRFEHAALLPKQSTRSFELLWPAPGVEAGDSKSSARRTPSSKSTELGVEWRGESSTETRQPATPLADHQALFVVLAESSSHYTFLAGFDALSATHRPKAPPEFDAHYRLVLADARPTPLLPRSYSAWSTAAYLLWDGFDATKLDAEQVQALLDWLHWGGTLIVAGPDTLDLGRLAPLTKYLPTTSVSFLELDADRLAPLAAFKIDEDPLDTNRHWPGVRMTLHAEARAVLGTREEPLIAERRVGRGRILATAFRPWQAELVRWPSYAGFFNTALMRRPGRRWQTHPNQVDFPTVVWADRPRIAPDHELWNGGVDAWYDPLRVSGVRYFTRGDDQPPPPPEQFALASDAAAGGGVAAWRENDSQATAIRESLRKAAGFSILPVATVARLLFFYIVAVVPLNWFLCRKFFKTEWAWIVLPFAAVAFTVVVVRAAGLDLGFVRSSAEIALVEFQPGYDRANVARFTSLYNSLGTTYSVSSEDPHWFAMPIPLSSTGDGKTAKYRRTLTFGDGAAGDDSRAMLGEFVVDSNTVGLFRSEQTTSLGGTIAATLLDERRVRITNGTLLELRDLRLVGRGHGFLDVLPPGGSAEITLTDGPPQPGDRAARQAGLDVDSLWERYLIVPPAEELRLVAWSASSLPGVSVVPQPTQQRSKIVVVAHLAYPEFPSLQRDANARRSVERALGIMKPNE